MCVMRNVFSGHLKVEAPHANYSLRSSQLALAPPPLLLFHSPTAPPLLHPSLPQVHKKYDLKGSTVDRDASEKEKQKKEPTLKDNDFVKDGVKMTIGEEAKEKLLDTLNADVGFLTKNEIMDYSLLLGIHDTQQVCISKAFLSRFVFVFVVNICPRRWMTRRRRTSWTRRTRSMTVAARGWP